jgi:Mg-chelatase subunit ChlD
MSALDTLAPIMARPWVHGHAFRRGIETFAHHACAALGLAPVEVAWTNYIRTAAINAHGTMLLPDCADDERKTKGDVARLAGYVTHELLHRKYTDFSARDRRPYVAALHNAIEDAWIERRAAREGLLGNVRPLLGAMIEDMVTESLQTVSDWTDPAQYPWALAVLARGYGVTVPVPGSLLPAFRSVADGVDGCTTSHDTLALARWLFDQLQQDPQQDQQQDQQQDSQGQDGQQDGPQGAQDGGGQDGQQDAQDGQQDGEGQDGQQQGQGGEGQGGQQQGDAPADAGPAQRPGPYTTPRETEPHPGHGTGPASGGSYQRKPAPPGKLGSYSSVCWASNLAVPARLRYEVRRLFENSAREWRDGGFRSGTLHRAALHKVPLDRPEIFARRFSEEGIDSAVVILLDISGSMNPEFFQPPYIEQSKIATAVSSCIMLMDCLAQAGAQSMVIAFGERTHVVKTWTQNWRTVVPTLQQIGTEGDTNDFHALRLAHEHLLQHPAQRRVVFALTDGEGNRDATREQRTSGEALGIQHWCLGIQHDARHTWGPNTIRVDRVADLGRVAFQQIKQAA